MTKTVLKAAHGVEALIDRLREEGVAAGQKDAESIVDAAERRGQWIVDQAEEEAERLLERTRKECGRLEAANREALQLAARDALLSVKRTLTQQFADQIRGLVRETMSEDTLLARLILEVAGRTACDRVTSGTEANLLLPAAHSEQNHADEPLTSFVVEQMRGMLIEGVTLGTLKDGSAGLRIQLTGEDVEIDLTDRAVADLLLQHLLPRFRAVLDGVVQSERGAQG